MREAASKLLIFNKLSDKQYDKYLLDFVITIKLV